VVVVVPPRKILGNLGTTAKRGTWAKPQATWVMLAWQLKESTGEATLPMRQMPPFCLAFVSGCIFPFFPKRIPLLQRRIPLFVS
jgi:hypothetical protein